MKDTVATKMIENIRKDQKSPSIILRNRHNYEKSTL